MMDNRHRELEGLLHMWEIGTRGRGMTLGERKDSERKNNYLRGRKGTMGERGDSEVDNIWHLRQYKIVDDHKGMSSGTYRNSMPTSVHARATRHAMAFLGPTRHTLGFLV